MIHVTKISGQTKREAAVAVAKFAEREWMRLAAERVAKSGGTLSLAQAVAEVLATPEGGRLYEQYQEARREAGPLGVPPEQPVEKTRGLSPRARHFTDEIEAPALELPDYRAGKITREQAIARHLGTPAGSAAYERNKTLSDEPVEDTNVFTRPAEPRA